MNRVSDVVDTMVDFLRGIGLEVRVCELDDRTFLPGVTTRQGALLYDPSRLKYPGDLLHEAGHIACTPASERPLLSEDMKTELGADLAAIAWSYAAAVHLDIDPAVVFHEGGYSGHSPAFIRNFRTGHFVGVPLLECAGMTEQKTRRNNPPNAYPKMLKWLREE